MQPETSPPQGVDFVEAYWSSLRAPLHGDVRIGQLALRRHDLCLLVSCIAFAREGADVVISYLPEEEADAKEVIRLIEAEGRKAVALPGDIKEETWCRELVEKAVSGLGGLDILVINAGRRRLDLQ